MILAIVGVVSFLIGVVCLLIGNIGLLIAEFKEHIAWGLLGLFTQIGHLIFAICHFDKCKKSLGFILLGIVLMIIGAMIIVTLGTLTSGS
ncbi:MAG: hypothetical protein IJS08_07840 [Victivallales bacterium]|nr:hypothetical protein [Victivallales bacterium]